jgi:hypothetical protein
MERLTKLIGFSTLIVLVYGHLIIKLAEIYAGLPEADGA